MSGEKDFVLVGRSGVIGEPDKPTILIDGDIICYSVGHAADGRKYRVLDGKGRPVFDSAADAGEYLKEIGLSTLWRETFFEPEPVANALHSVKLMIESIVDTCSPGSPFIIFLSGPDNFRHSVSDTYKQNREGARSPHHLKACQKYLIERYNTIVIHGAEADDAMGVMQCFSDNTIIASLDKDLDMIPGKHFRWSLNGSDPRLYSIDEVEAFRCFCRQLITGDTTDNIEGLSEKAPHKRTYSTAPIDAMTSYIEMLRYVAKGYVAKYKDGALARDMMKRDGKLLWILRGATIDKRSPSEWHLYE